MARPHYLFHRANDPNFRETIRLARQGIAEATRVLQTCEPPDTFLGRQHYDFISLPSEDVIE